MWFLFVSIVILALLLGAFTFIKRNATNEEVKTFEVDEECCGAHEICERESLYNNSTTIEYFDDEELDALSFVSPIDFTLNQLEQLEHVFYTLDENDVAAWLRSLQARNIQLPIDLREEALLIVSERRSK